MASQTDLVCSNRSSDCFVPALSDSILLSVLLATEKQGCGLHVTFVREVKNSELPFTVKLEEIVISSEQERACKSHGLSLYLQSPPSESSCRMQWAISK